MAEVLLAGGVTIDVATKADVQAHHDRLARLLERPHARFHRYSGGAAPRAGNLPSVIRLDTPRPPTGWMWLLQWASIIGDDPTISGALGAAAAAAFNTDTAVDNSANTTVAAVLAATLPGVAGQTTFISGFEITGDGATAGSVIAVTVTGILGGTKTYYIVVPLGIGNSITPLLVEFATPIPASALNTAIVVNVPSFGAGNTAAAVTAHGFQRLVTAAAAGSSVRAAIFVGARPNDAAIPNPPSSGLDYAGAIMPGMVVPSGLISFPDKNVVYTEEEVYAVIAGTGLVAGAAFYHFLLGVIELPQRPDALMW